MNGYDFIAKKNSNESISSLKVLFLDNKHYH